MGLRAPRIQADRIEKDLLGFVQPPDLHQDDAEVKVDRHVLGGDPKGLAPLRHGLFVLAPLNESNCPAVVLGDDVEALGRGCRGSDGGEGAEEKTGGRPFREPSGAGSRNLAGKPCGISHAGPLGEGYITGLGGGQASAPRKELTRGNRPLTFVV